MLISKMLSGPNTIEDQCTIAVKVNRQHCTLTVHLSLPHRHLHNDDNSILNMSIYQHVPVIFVRYTCS